MDNQWIILAFSLLVTLVFLSKLLNPRRLKSNIPPGPKPWPIIGNLNLLGSLPHKSLHLLSQKYGEIMHLKFGSFPVVVTSSPEMAKLVLRTHDSIFASRPVTAAGKYTNYNYSDLAWSPYGPYFRQVRKIFASEILNPKSLDSFEYIRVEERNEFMSRLYNLSGEKIELRHHLNLFTLSIISRKVVGDKLKLEDFEHAVQQYFLLNGVFNIGDWIPWLRFFDLQGYVKQMKDYTKNFDGVLSNIVDDHEAKRRGGKNFLRKDMVDILLELAEDPKLEVKLSRDSVKALIVDLLFGGTHTAAAAVEWAMAELLKRPHVIRKATEELDRVIGKNRWVEEGDFVNLPYIDAIIKETFRLHPLATLLPPHNSMEDCKIGDYNISKGTNILVNVWSIGRNPKYWEKAEEFYPERFIGKDIDILGQSFVVLPFGSGRRMCPGYLLGIKLVFIGLANILHGFSWKLPDNMKPEDISMEEIFGLATQPKVPLPVVAEPRLPVHLYKAVN